MTAVNALITPAAGFLSADAAIWNPDGTVRETASKIVVVKAAATALAGRGIFSQGLLSLHAREARDLHELHDRLQDFAQGNDKRVSRDGAWVGWKGDFEVYGVSWWEGEPVGWLIAARFDEPMRFTGLTYSPDVDLTAAMGQPVASSAAFGALDPATAWPTLMEAQRAQTFETTAGGLHCVGGWCDLATVTAGGVSVETLRWWSDVPGRKIVP